MSTDPMPSPREELAAGIRNLHANRNWILALGVVLILVGSVAISLTARATITAIETIGLLLLFAAGGQVASAIWTRGWDGVLSHLLTGIVYGILGCLILAHPGVTAAMLTVLIAASFLIGGLFRMIAALALRFHGWGWTLVSGAITFGLGLMIWQQWPGDSLWVIGLFLGIDLIFAGWTWVALAMGLGRLPVKPA
jgi:uncharacterized membrane protein HdeD (DUF308 family)